MGAVQGECGNIDIGCVDGCVLLVQFGYLYKMQKKKNWYLAILLQSGIVAMGELESE